MWLQQHLQYQMFCPWSGQNPQRARCSPESDPAVTWWRMKKLQQRYEKKGKEAWWVLLLWKWIAFFRNGGVLTTKTIAEDSASSVLAPLLIRCQTQSGQSKMWPCNYDQKVLKMTKAYEAQHFMWFRFNKTSFENNNKINNCYLFLHSFECVSDLEQQTKRERSSLMKSSTSVSVWTVQNSRKTKHTFEFWSWVPIICLNFIHFIELIICSYSDKYPS